MDTNAYLEQTKPSKKAISLYLSVETLDLLDDLCDLKQVNRTKIITAALNLFNDMDEKND
jgi:hypothetical protein